MLATNKAGEFYQAADSHPRATNENTDTQKPLPEPKILTINGLTKKETRVIQARLL